MYFYFAAAIVDHAFIVQDHPSFYDNDGIMHSALRRDVTIDEAGLDWAQF